MSAATEQISTPDKTDTTVVTGIGVVSPIGIGTDRFWNNLIAGTSGIGEVQALPTDGMRSSLAAEVLDFSFEPWADERGWPRDLGRTTEFALAAGAMALDDSGLPSAGYERERIAVIGGSTVGEAPVAEAIIPRWRREGPGSIAISEFAQLSPGLISATLAWAFDLWGPNTMVLTSCASGNQAIAYGCDLLRDKRVDAALVGGADALSMMTFVGFNRLLSLAQKRCQPFDLNRKGLVLGEGLAFLVLERLQEARRRGATIYGEVIGCSLGFDAHHMTAPHPQGRGGEESIRAGLQSAGVGTDDIDYISAHGTGTQQNDRIETKLVRKVFGERADEIPISSIKSMIGHTMGTASVFEAIACLRALEEGIIPPTINFETPDPECDLDYVPNEARVQPVRTALSQSFAFGGNISTLVLRRHEPEGAPSLEN